MSLSVFAQEGLLRVVRLLESLPDDRFNLSTWHNRNRCGTTYCAMGYAASTEWFQQHGLSLDGNGGICLKRAHERTEDGFYAVAQFFGISSCQAQYLFLPKDGYYSRTHVINRIRKFVARDGERGGHALRTDEKARLDKMLAELDARLVAEKTGDPAALMRKALGQGEQLVPATR